MHSRQREHWRVLAALLLFGVVTSSWGAQADDAEGDWRMLSTPRYTIFSQQSERETRDWARGFDQFISAAAQLVNADIRRLPKVTVVMFSRNDTFTPYKPRRPDGTRANAVVGVFSLRPSWGVIGIGDSRHGDSLRTIYHEAAHWIMSGEAKARPRWYEEGVAETLEKVEFKDGVVRWGARAPEHVDNAAWNAIVPMKRLFNLADDDPLFNDDERTGVFYSTSWAVVHYCLFSQHLDRLQGLDDYLRDYGSLPPDEAFRRSFGIEYAQLDEELRTYVAQGKYGTLERKPPPPPDDAVLSKPTPAQVHAALGRLALATRNVDLARGHMERASALDRSLVGVRELRALLAVNDKDEGSARMEATLAVKLGSRDSDMFMLASEGEPDARKRADAYERALMVAPRFLPAYARLLSALHEIDQPTPVDRSFVELGRRAYPQERAMVLALAEIADKNGDPQRARQLQEEAKALNPLP